jgi:hypothetical protein
MIRFCFFGYAFALVLLLTSCAPPYAWGSNQRVKGSLIQIVPLGSSPAQLEAEASKRGWSINHSNIRSAPAGTETHFDQCPTRDGIVVPVVVARYSAPFRTYVETLWLFDAQHRLRDVCVRKTVDAL